jgi:putative transposase
LGADEKNTVLSVLHEPRFVDLAPAQVYSQMLDEGTYLCSLRTMYRILASANEVRERRNQLRHPAYAVPRLLATKPNQVWTWDITKLLGPQKWTYYHLYVMLDIFSRYVVGWLLAGRESAILAKRFIDECCDKQEIKRNELTIHADRGTSMRSKTVSQLMADLGVLQSHSRPRVSNDNPFSESQFKTLKYRPDFPEQLGSLEHGKEHFTGFFDWYNNEHRHSGIGLMTPFMVHYGLTDAVRKQRQEVLNRAYQLHPERFVRKQPEAPRLPREVWINPPEGTRLVSAIVH